MGAREWTVAEEADLLVALENGTSRAELARDMDRTEGAIHRRLQEIIWRNAPRRGGGKNPRPWSSRDDDLIQELRARGVTLARIADMTARSQSSIWSRLDVLRRRAMRKAAEAQPLETGGPVPTGQQRWRTCMRPSCNAEFLSENFGHRMCDRCRKATGDDGSEIPHTVTTPGGTSGVPVAW